VRARDVITDERLYKKLPIPRSSPPARSPRQSRHSAAPRVPPGFLIFPFCALLLGHPSSLVSRRSLARLRGATRFCREQKWRMKE
jgi:hypothetical protein